MTLADELAAETRRNGTPCGTCAWLASLPVDEQAEWDEAFAGKWQTAALVRLAVKKGCPVGANGISGHRHAEHRR